MDIVKRINCNVYYGFLLMLSRMSLWIIVFLPFLYLLLDDKYNAIPKSSELSEEDLQLVQSFRNELLKIASFMNLSIVDENDISSILDVFMILIFERIGY